MAERPIGPRFIWLNQRLGEPVERWIDKRSAKWHDKVDKDEATTLGGLVDLVFAIIIAQSFAIFVPGHATPSAVEYFRLALSYVTVVVSWVYYHKSKARNDYRLPYRFIVDLAILFCYWVLISYYTDFYLVAIAYALMLWLYMVWGMLKIAEYRNNVLRYFFRLPFAIGATLVVVFSRSLASPFAFLDSSWPAYGGWPNGIVIAIVAAIALLYRWNVIPTWGRMRSTARDWATDPQTPS